MHSRLSTTCLPLLALAVALILVGHDAVMAAGPHDSAGAQAAHHDHDHPSSDTACGELVAVRAPDPMPGLDVAVGPGEAVAPAAAEGVVAGDAGDDRRVTMPAPSRAMLQIWLN